MACNVDAPGKKRVLRSANVASDTVINFWCHVGLVDAVNRQVFSPNAVQAGDPSEAGTEMVPSSSSLAMPGSPS
jgi:hypothetical protein